MSVALNLYSRAPDPWTPELITAADGYAQLVGSMVLTHLDLAELEDAAAGLYRNMSDALVAERAVGAIMHTNACSEDEARRILESASRHRRIGAREVAETILRALVDVRTTDQGSMS
ncbi:ANTAR domain-containing protein [Isoptericola halotolerans]|uniref:ANTAR domain-containing protein n=1 Tax=Isoptericola halotolerans TaxID=300560 RepID=UPI00388DB82E